MPKITASLTRPNTTTTYTAGDVVSTAAGLRLNFYNVASLRRDAIIQSAVCIVSMYVATTPDVELWLFDTDLTDLDVDNAAWTPTDAQMLTCVGMIAFPTANFKTGDLTAGTTGNVACFVNNVGIGTSAETLYGVLVMRNGYVPIASEIYTVVLNVKR